VASTVQKWGNSLGIRLPKAIAEQANLQNGTQIEFDTSNGMLTIRPRRRRSRYKLAHLLAKIKGPSPHRRLISDPPVGRELL
jgi:antitoxin MazE